MNCSIFTNVFFALFQRQILVAKTFAIQNFPGIYSSF